MDAMLFSLLVAFIRPGRSSWITPPGRRLELADTNGVSTPHLATGVETPMLLRRYG